MSLSLTGVPAAPLADRKDDLYETPECAIRALMAVETLPRAIWEPACGPGAIVKVLREVGHSVVATDLVEYGCEDSQSRVDFLMERSLPANVGAILTNPPYKLAEEFVRHALGLGAHTVVMLLRLAFLEGEGRRDILEDCGLARVHVFRNRLPMMHRFQYTGPKASSAIAFAWYVWQRGYGGPTIMRRVSWK